MQKWSILLKEADRDKMAHVKEGIMSWMKSFKPRGVAPTDVFEI